MSTSVDKAGTYALVLLLTHAPNYGTYQVEIDGKPVHPYATAFEVRERLFGGNR